MKAVRSFTVRPRLPEPLAGLDRLAANLRWSWSRSTRNVFETIDPGLWATTGHDPRRLLATVDAHRLDELAADSAFVDRVAAEVEGLDGYLGGTNWYQEQAHGLAGVVAYFSPEFGIAEAVPQYSGGLGILAGDHLKAASDLGVPLVGIGLFYRHGYFRQTVSVDGWQEEVFPDLDPYAMSMDLCDDVRVTVELAGEKVVAQAWRADVGGTPLYLLDSDIDENPDHLRTLTDRLYGGDTEHRLRQEILLGIGGVRMLRELGIPASVFHTNEGHAGFLGLERIREFMHEQGLSFDEAWLATRAGCVFTTHTPVPAGIDRFPRELIERYFGQWASEVGIGIERLLAIGHRPSESPDDPFNMAVMGMRLAERRNGVAKLHGRVSRSMFGDLWNDVPTDEVPIGSVTNGVHAATWIGREMAEVFTEHVGPDWQRRLDADWSKIHQAPAAELWGARRQARSRLVDFTRDRLRSNGIARGMSLSELGWCDEALDPDRLTICFARRFATYKRAALLLSQPDRLRRLLLDRDRPVQFIFAGKAHPADNQGKELIRQIVAFSHEAGVRSHFCFIDDYDMAVSRHLLHGADVWLNTPLRPQEACGTSGMKSAMNGGLNCSILDGWWDECFDPEVGWAISSADSVGDADRRNELEANSLFDLLEQQVVPRFYDCDAEGLPQGWIHNMAECIATLTPFLTASRMVRDYVEQYYRPAADHGRQLSADGFDGARTLAKWRRRIIDEWHNVHIDEVTADESVADLATDREVAARLSLGELAPTDVEVQLVTGNVGQAGELERRVSIEMSPDGEATDGHWTYRVALPLRVAGRRGITVRIVPRDELLADPLELGCVAWAR